MTRPGATGHPRHHPRRRGHPGGGSNPGSGSRRGCLGLGAGLGRNAAFGSLPGLDFAVAVALLANLTTMVAATPSAVLADARDPVSVMRTP